MMTYLGLFPTQLSTARVSVQKHFIWSIWRYLIWRYSDFSSHSLLTCELTGKDPDAGKDWRREEKGTTEDETVGWHHQLDGHEFEQAPGVGGQGSLACCSPWGCKESDMTEWLNWTELNLWTAIREFSLSTEQAECGDHFHHFWPPDPSSATSNHGDPTW